MSRERIVIEVLSQNPPPSSKELYSIRSIKDSFKVSQFFNRYSLSGEI
jgi:hypothetical protein